MWRSQEEQKIQLRDFRVQTAAHQLDYSELQST